MSDSDSSVNSDCGIRFKTQSVRNLPQENSIFDKQKNNDYEYNKYDKRYVRDDDYRYRKRHKHLDDRSRSSSRREDYAQDERTKSKRENIKKLYDCEDNSKRKKENVKDVTDSEETKKEILKLDNEVIDTYGPTLPPTQHHSENEQTNESLNTYGPCLPSKLESNIDDVKSYGPTVQSSCTKNQENSENIKTYGPVLPSTCTKNVPIIKENESSESVKIYGPTLPSTSTDSSNPTSLDNHNESDDEDVIGPLLPGMTSNSRVQSELECRALELRMKLEFPSVEQKTREDWMVELPDIQKVSGLGARKFRANPGPDLSDRTSWTDTPENKSKKHSSKSMKDQLKIEAESREIQRRDKEQEKIIKNHKKHSKRDKSLMDMHQQKLSKEKTESGKTERRPFNRDIDLKLNMFDPEKKSRMLKNACLLDDKFSSGKSKYL